MHTSFALATLFFAVIAVAAPGAHAEAGLEKREPQATYYTPTPTATGGSGQSGTSTASYGLDSDEQSVLDAHNQYRAKHGAKDLTWNPDLASYAASYASSCSFGHTYGPNGENIASGYSSAKAAVAAWYDEIEYYDFSNPGFSESTGHFTQVVWLASTEIGCAYISCYTDSAPGWYLMCEYSPPGNVLGSFAKNVLES